MAINVQSRQRLVSIDKRRIANLAQKTLAAAGKGGHTLAIVFLRDLAMQNANRLFRGRDETTDVLSFPLEPYPRVAPPDSEAGRFVRAHLGDIAVSTDTALRQAKEAGHSLERELDELVIHGVLHLCGYDHETDSGEMNRLELTLRKELLGDVA